ncbi:holdfast anchor protein HfaD [Brevundimonas sp. UBA5866]|uniref:holdfast anchor protein HfaD n=1 Tax=Brevundimonas sp. UBA5866 TaxID=1946132 RepID=UPI0025B7B20C|nr:holdfast anchor protein HfaD [Brevundimonas sp. UBA5866]
MAVAWLAGCAAAANSTQAQDGQARSFPIVLNEQIQFGDVFAGQRLNVVVARQQITVSDTALGNRVSGGSVGQDLYVQNRQYQHGVVSADTALHIEDEASGRLTVVTQARGNEASVAANHAELALDSDQASYGSVRASVALENDSANLTGGSRIATAAYANALTAGGQNTRVTGSIQQSASADTVAQTYAPARYVPGTSHFTAEATANTAMVTSTGASSQNLAVRQTAEGWVGAEAVSSAANAWNSSTTAVAGANRLSTLNAGGLQVVSAEQINTGSVQGRTSTYAYDYGDLRSIAEGAANTVIVGNQDIWVEIDNNQLNSGGVMVEAELSGHNGYDAYVGANASGNTVTAYACSECAGSVNANSVQVNHGAVTATAVTNLSGQSRAVITGTTATGNNASFYVTRTGN